MPNRVIKDTIWKSKSLAKLKPYYQDQWPRWLLMSDDWGCFDADPEIIKGLVYPKRKERVKDIKNIMEAFCAAGLLFLWSCGDREWGFFVNWDLHQYVGSLQYDAEGNRVRHRRKTPEPPKDLLDKYLQHYGTERNGAEQNGAKVPIPIPIPNPIISSQIKDLLVSFPHPIQPDIITYWKIVASKNRTKRITLGRKLTLIKELSKVYKGSKQEDFRYALLHAIKYNAPNVNYIKAIIKNKKTTCLKCKGKGKYENQKGYTVPCDVCLQGKIRDTEARKRERPRL